MGADTFLPLDYELLGLHREGLDWSDFPRECVNVQGEVVPRHTEQAAGRKEVSLC